MPHARLLRGFRAGLGGRKSFEFAPAGAYITGNETIGPGENGGSGGSGGAGQGGSATGGTFLAGFWNGDVHPAVADPKLAAPVP
ncbi:MAG: hypothetical protein JRI23_15990 [Deltaproteobacteria bacterium]|jgi:hypothetical protein|nr:hypothetical protein [Deltaproteobacteria bacterium]MBW2533266.1 hypothetical protein [Deltaproteobacteria bacterium]